MQLQQHQQPEVTRIPRVTTSTSSTTSAIMRVAVFYAITARIVAITFSADPEFCQLVPDEECLHTYIKTSCKVLCSASSGPECGSFAAVEHIAGKVIKLGGAAGDRIKQPTSTQDSTASLIDMGGMASLHSSATDLGPSTHMCGGILISRKFILTAAHCVRWGAENRIRGISLGRTDLNVEPSPENEMYEVLNVYPNPGYGSRVNQYNDVAIIQLDRHVEYTEKIWPYCLPKQDEAFAENSPVTISGWGQVNQSHNSPILQSAEVDLVTNECEDILLKSRARANYESLKRHSYPQGITAELHCAGRRGVDACKGDSGGPLLFKRNNGRNTAIGIIAKGLVNCPDVPIVPGFYTNTARYIDWIYDITKIQRPSEVNSTPQARPTSHPVSQPNQSTGTLPADVCVEGRTWVKDCNDCNCRNGQEYCTSQGCQSAITARPSTTARPRPLTTTRPITPARPLTTVPLHSSQRPLAAPPNQPTSFSPSSAVDLYNAAARGDLQSVNSALATGADPQWRNPAFGGATALHAAAGFNHPAVVKVLLDAGVDKDLQTHNGQTPIYEASYSGSVDALMTLIAYGADVNLTNTNGDTPVLAAATYGHLGAVQELIKANADVNIPNSDGNTPVKSATKYGHLPVVQELISANVNIHAVGGRYGNTVLHIAALFHWATQFDQQAIAQLLLDNGASASKLNKDGQTPGAVARQRGHVALGNFIDNYAGNSG